MKWFLAALVVLFVLRCVVGAVRGRVRVRPCCPPPEEDLRLREDAQRTDAQHEHRPLSD